MLLERVISRQRLNSALPLIVSACVHIGLLAILSIWLVPAIRRAGIWLNAQTTAADQTELVDVSVQFDRELEAPLPHSDSMTVLPDLRRPIPLANPLDDLRPDVEPTTIQARTLVGQGDSLRRASSVEGAVDGITAAILGALQQGDLTVVWLFDASHSLVDDRQRIAVRLESFLSDTADTPGHLSNTVVSFGARMKQRVRETQSRVRVIHSIKTLPIDPSGEEQVFDAITQCITKYGAPDHTVMIVVWTDESGDDTDRLEKTIVLSRKKDVHVHVVGPSAVLGADTGFHAYTDPKSGLNYPLPVTRGPDAAMEERLRLGYWFQTRAPDRIGFELPAWYGGQDLAGISSPFSPFALTRLAIETGGSFTILDNPADRPPFDLDAMKDYLPQYGSVEDYTAQLEFYPLRSAILEAVKVTRGQRELTVPPLLLFGHRSEVPPYRFEAPYLEPNEFARKLRSARAGLIRRAAGTARLVDQALAHVSVDGNIDQGLDELYTQEASPRWKAWYDLTRGRLLAANVRLEEYRLACETLADRKALQETTNFIRFLASGTLRSDATFARRAEEAKLLLYRCVQQNGDTPWAYLAQRELDFALGITVRQQALQLTGAAPSQRKPALPKF